MITATHMGRPVDPAENARSKPCRECRALRKHLKDLTSMTAKVIKAIDAEMDLPSSHERGKRIARLTNTLEVANDIARHFGLGQPLSR